MKSPVKFYTAVEFGKAIKAKLKETNDVMDIAKWAQEYTLLDEVEQSVQNAASNLSMIEWGGCYRMTIAEIDDMANRLIAGEEVAWVDI